MTYCPHCGQRVPSKRHGIAIPPLKLRIFDLIKSRPGITSAEIAAIVYDTPDKAGIVRVHVGQLREMFLDHPVQIRGVAHYGYRITAA